jgi:hypothetical protein
VGDMCLVAWIDGQIEGLQIEPEASQSRGSALVVVHLPRGR